MPKYLQPSGFVLLRVIGAFLLFFSFYSIGATQKIEKKDFRRLVDRTRSRYKREIYTSTKI